MCEIIKTKQKRIRININPGQENNPLINLALRKLVVSNGRKKMEQRWRSGNVKKSKMRRQKFH